MQKKKRGKEKKNFVISNRRIIQAIIGAAIYYLIHYFQISLWGVLAFGTFTGLIWGKVFCRWMCPLGFMMEIFMNMNPDQAFKNTYQYHKIGCPIAWFSGFLNRFSFYKISFDKDKCTSCGVCDKSCYISTLDSKFSLFRNGKKDPALQLSCSKCLKCVEKCPTGSLTYKFDILKR